MTLIIAFVLMIVLSIAFIITSIKDGRYEEIGVPIVIIVIMIIAIVMFIRDPEVWFGNNEAVPTVVKEPESNDKTNIRFTEEVYRTDKSSRIYILTDTETGCQYIWYRNGITKLENTEVE